MSNGTKRIFTFRIGDIVRLYDWGEVYCNYKEGFEYFNHSRVCPYYCGGNGTEDSSYTDYLIRKNKRVNFKIIGMAIHPDKRTILAYLRDRCKRDVLTSINGCILIKQYPLRKNEKTEITLKQLKLF